MLLSDVTEKHIGQKVHIDRTLGEFVGIVAWVERQAYRHFNSDKYLPDDLGYGYNRGYTRLEKTPYTGQKDYYYLITQIVVGFYGGKTLNTELKEEYDIDVEDPNHAAYLREQTG